MEENEKNKKLIITPLDESAEEIGEILSSETCRKILNVIADEPLSSTQIAEKLGIALTTVEYNINKLDKAGLLAIHHKQWSPKGKKVNFYAPAEKYILIAPKKKSSENIMKSLRMLLIPALVVLIITAGFFSFYNPPKVSETGGTGAGFEDAQRYTTGIPPAGEGEKITGPTAAGGAPEGGALAAVPGNFTNNTTVGEVN